MDKHLNLRQSPPMFNRAPLHAKPQEITGPDFFLKKIITHSILNGLTSFLGLMKVYYVFYKMHLSNANKSTYCRQNPSREYVRYFGRLRHKLTHLNKYFMTKNIRFLLSNTQID